MMKKGDVINGYLLTTDAQNGGGQCEWAFAKKDGEAFFIKRFLRPTYPVEGSPGSQKTKADKRARSEAFERQQRQVMRKLGEISGEGGNLVVTRAFFRDGPHFYKVTLKVDVTRIGPEQIAALPRDGRILIMLTAAKSLETLHRAGLVHGDVKPDNLLVKALPGGGHAIKVIDFDNCFPVNHPAPADQLVGDMAFYSPELYLYHVGEGRGDVLDDKNDVFALGLVFWQYLTGCRPALPPGKVYAAQAVLAGTSFSLPKSVRDVPVAEVVGAMLAKDPGDRPSMSEVHSSLKNARKSLPEGKPIRLEPREPKRPTGRPRLRGKLFRGHPAGAAEPAASVGAKPLFAARLFGRFARPGMGFAPAPDSDVGAAMPEAPVIDVVPALADAPSPGAAAGSDGAGPKLTGKLLSKVAAVAVDAPDSSGAPGTKFRGTLMRKTAGAEDSPGRADVADAIPVDGPDAMRGGEKDIVSGDRDAATEEPTVGGKLRGTLKRRE
jgi:eukaryotic-like serine/threonine-protein kinase